MWVSIRGRIFDWDQRSIDMAIANGIPVEVRVSNMNYHPKHHQTCFCVVCRGQVDGHITDPCQCERCSQ